MDAASLTVIVPPPPESWRSALQEVPLGLALLSLWETTICLIANEPILGQDQRRYLAMINEHRVSGRCYPTRSTQLNALQLEFERLQARVEPDLSVPETDYLWMKLLQGPRSLPTFGGSGFRELSDPEQEAERPQSSHLDIPRQDERVVDLDRECRRLRRTIADLEVAERLMKLVMERKLNARVPGGAGVADS